MARLIQRVLDPVKERVYDVTVAGTHSFFAFSRNGEGGHAVLAHNCHELSKQAFDVLLKPLEDNIRGTQDKQLVCIFCTTEVEKMRPAILSRCAPTFRIRPNTPEEIAKRLAYICQSEGLEFEADALPLIAEVVECHVRDAIKAIEGVSMLGEINRANVHTYLSLDANGLFLEILEHLGEDVGEVLRATEQVVANVAPGVCYEKMADLCMLAYRLVHAGAAVVPSYWDRERLLGIGQRHKEFLIQFAQRFAERPGRPTPSMFACDVSSLHQMRSGIVVKAQATEVFVPALGGDPVERPVQPSPQIQQSSYQPVNVPSNLSAKSGNVTQETIVTEMGVALNPIAQKIRPTSTNGGIQSIRATGALPPLSVSQFVEILQRRVQELAEDEHGGSTRRHNVGGP